MVSRKSAAKRDGPTHAIPIASAIRKSRKLDIFPVASWSAQNPSVAATPAKASKIPIAATIMNIVIGVDARFVLRETSIDATAPTAIPINGLRP